MNFKTIFGSITSSLLIITTLLAIPCVHSAETTTIYISPQYIDSFAEDTCIINVSIANVVDLNAWQVQLYFNPSILNCTDVRIPPDDIFAGQGTLFPPNIDNTAGFVRSFCALPGNSTADGSGTLFQIEFKCIAAGSSGLNISTAPYETYLLDPNMNQISWDAVDGMVKVAKRFSVPFHYQTKTYYSGPASLEMVFDFYGEDIPQYEIADVARTFPNVTYTDELTRAGHFSNLSTSMGEEMPQSITGYSLRNLGYAAFEKSGLTLSQLKASVNSGYLIIVLTWYDLSKLKGHYRVVVGCNQTHIIFHDPWNKTAWGGAYGGPNEALDYSTFSNLWNYSNYWGLFIHPWEVTTKATMIQSDTFNVTASVSYVCPEAFRNVTYSATSCNATLILTPGISLGQGENATKTLGTGTLSPGASAEVGWTVNASVPGNYTVRALGMISGSVGSHGSYPSYDYEDRIGGESVTTILRSPLIGDITGPNDKPDGMVDMRDIATAARAFGSYPSHPRWDPRADLTSLTYLVPDGVVDMRDIALIARHFGDHL